MGCGIQYFWILLDAVSEIPTLYKPTARYDSLDWGWGWALCLFPVCLSVHRHKSIRETDLVRCRHVPGCSKGRRKVKVTVVVSDPS